MTMKMQNNGFQKSKEIVFPVRYDLKVIMTAKEDPNENIKAIEPILSELKIDYKDWSHKPSGKGTYTSFSVNVLIKDQHTLTKLYEKLGLIPGVKMAL